MINGTMEDQKRGEEEEFGGNDSFKVNMTKNCLQSVRKCDSEGPSVQTRETSSH